MTKLWCRLVVSAMLALVTTTSWALSPQWAVPAGYPGKANKVVTDAQGNVYVTGSTYSAVTDAATSAADMLTVKYDANGVKQWEATYNGPESGVDVGVSLVLDTSGNVLVAGYSYFSNPQPGYGALCATVVKYSPTGTQLWVTRYPDSNHSSAASSIDVDPDGNAYVSMTTIYDFASGNAIDGIVVKYDAASGSRQWKYYMGYPGLWYTDDWAGKLMVKDGFVYVAGTFGGGTHGYDNNYRDSVVWKFSLDGQLAHMDAFNGGSSDYAADFTVDGEGNVYLASMSDRLRTGTTMWDAYAYDYVTTKFDAAGTLLWSSRYNNGGSGDHAPSSIAVDAAGNVFVTGSSDGTGTGKDIATVKYDSSGNQVWVDRYSGTASGDDLGGSVLVGANGDVFVSGTSLNAGSGLDVTAIKYSNSSGARQWVSLYGKDAGVDETVNAAALGPKDVFVLTGFSAAAGSDPQLLTAKLIEVLDVPVDIRPGTFPNTVSPGSSGQVPVAILSFPSFDATAVDPASVRFGAGALKVAARSFTVQDVNGDGNPDLVLQFPTQGSGIICGTTTGVLTGATRLGQAIKGSDSIVTTSCK